MGSKSKSKSSTTSHNYTYDTTTTFTDNRDASGDGNIFGGSMTFSAAPNSSFGNLSVVQTDHGAIAGAVSLGSEAMGLGMHSLDFASEAYSTGLDTIAETTRNSLKSINENAALTNQFSQQVVDRSMALARESTRSELASSFDQIQKLVVIVVAVAAGAWVLPKVIK